MGFDDFRADLAEERKTKKTKLKKRKKKFNEETKLRNTVDDNPSLDDGSELRYGK